MDPLALAFVALAAVLHVAWNVLVKTGRDPLATATIGVIAASLLAAPVAFAGWLLADRPAVPPTAWLVGLASGAVETVYFVFLAEAYRRGDLSVVYPIARGSAPVLAVAVGVLVLGERLPAMAWLGVGMLIAGLFAVQRPWRFLRGGATDRGAAGFALLTGAAIAGYTSLDRVGVGLTPPWLYAAILWPACGVGLAAVWVVRRRRALAGGPAFDPGVVDRPRAVLAGLLTFVAYAFVLAALARAPLAVVAPMRESAVVLASAWGVLWLREGVTRRESGFRLAGSVLVLAGAAVLAGAGR